MPKQSSTSVSQETKKTNTFCQWCTHPPMSARLLSSRVFRQGPICDFTISIRHHKAFKSNSPQNHVVQLILQSSQQQSLIFILYIICQPYCKRQLFVQSHKQKYFPSSHIVRHSRLGVCGNNMGPLLSSIVPTIGQDDIEIGCGQRLLLLIVTIV